VGRSGAGSRRRAGGATISAATATAVSSGVRAPRSRPMGERSRASSVFGEACFAQPGLGGPHGCGGSPSRPTRPSRIRRAPTRSGMSNFGSWVRTHTTVRSSRRPASALGVQIPVRPVDHDLVGRGGKRRAVAKTGARVADGDVVAEEAAHAARRPAAKIDRARKTIMRGAGACDSMKKVTIPSLRDDLGHGQDAGYSYGHGQDPGSGRRARTSIGCEGETAQCSRRRASREACRTTASSRPGQPSWPARPVRPKVP